MKNAYRWMIVLLSLASANVGPALAQSAARADFVVGAVTAVAADGSKRVLAKGGDLRSGEAVLTGEGRAQLSFTDGASVSLQPKTEFRVDEYKFTGVADGSERGIFSLVKGALRTITGLVGRTNRDRYQMRTAVATIGIRGTEYSAEFETGLKVTTTNGEVEVCNQGGCTPVKAGESVFTPNANTKPAYVVGSANLPPTPPPANPTLFTGGDLVTATGGIPIPKLSSGPGYSMAFAGFDNSDGVVPVAGSVSSTTAAFDETGRLSSFSDRSDSGKATVHAEGSTDGVLAWGRWASATGSVSGSATTYANFHYVTGVKTPSSALSSLSTAVFPQGIGKATYTLMGATQPTAANGTIGGNVTGSLTVQFGSTTTLSTLLSVPIGAGSFTLSGSGVTGFPIFSGTVSSSCSPCTAGATAGTAAINGGFFGATAERAGMAYKFNGGSMGDVTGAAVFKR